ncbi:PLP-dependent aminotransferase family protein [Desulfosporosinus sp. OT]|uniref:MocR-like pyridoxine biosynthesis transcription factor PdxR n=1 Tax=Desulfosporosinus sp. OT TaxID=913865 RepID=UPI000223B263|nr:PLP-dependent aminotransferase family protein [Desulfosporosinus sp. OT]EGW38184.1 bacterial regulatory s, gntR family protein [Desulfosporosinus sp. OT]
MGTLDKLHRQRIQYSIISTGGYFLVYILNNKSPIPLYAQLYQQIRSKVLCGKLHPGTKMPSSRKLSQDLCISRNTVGMAYDQLHSEGFLVCRARSGFYVEDLDITGLQATPNQNSYEPMRQETEPETIHYDFTYGRLSPKLFPFLQWQRVTNECLRSYKEQMVNYGEFMGERGLRREMLKYLREYRNIQCSIDQLMIAPGTQHCLMLAGQLLKTSTSTIAIEDPGFSGAYFTFTNQGFRVQPIPLDHHGLKVKALSTSNTKAVYVTPSHQFPTGSIMSITRRLRLIEWANEQDAYIIEDDYSSHLRYDVKPIQPLQALAPERVIYISSFSKILSPAIRVAYMVLPEKLARESHRLTENSPSPVPFLIQKPLELFIQQGNWESHLRKITKYFKKKHDTLLQALNQEFGDTLSISGKNAGLHLLLQIKWPMTTEELVSRAYKAGVKIHPTGKLWVESESSPHTSILLGFGGIELGDIPVAVRLLRKAWLD